MNDYVASLAPYFRNGIRRTTNDQDGNYKHMGGASVVRAGYGDSPTPRIGWKLEDGIRAELAVGVDRWW